MKTYIIILIGLFININCSSSINSEIEGRFVVDKQQMESNLLIQDSTLFYNTDFTFIYHLENASGNLIEYAYAVQILPNGSASGRSWSDRLISNPRDRTTNFLEMDRRDTLNFQLKLSVDSTNTRIIYRFYIMGFYYDEPKLLADLENDKNLDSFFYFHEDTLNNN